MILRDEKTFSITKQCKLLGLPRSTLYYAAKGESPENEKLMWLLDKQHLVDPTWGARQMARYLRRLGHAVGRKRVRRLMQIMGLEAIYRRPRTSIPATGHKIYPYLLRDMSITKPNQVWCTDLTYIPMRRGFLYLVAVMDWHSRKVLSWRLSNTMDVRFCAGVLNDALEKYSPPDIFNSDQGSPFTSDVFTSVLKKAGVQISMDGKGRWMDNVFIERLWRSVKYECVYLHAFADGHEAKEKIGAWLTRYNTRRPHSALAGQTPDEAYTKMGIQPWAA